MPQNLITPLEPGQPRVSANVEPGAAVAQQSIHTTAFRRIEAAVASSCGSQHESNEDAHSALDPAGSLYVVADGVGGGAMAQVASRQLVAHLRSALDAAPLNAEGVRRAMLDADRAIAQRIAKVTDSPGAATVALCAPVNLLASKWLIAWVGDCRVYRLAMHGQRAIEMLTCDDTFRPSGRTAALRRLARRSGAHGRQRCDRGCQRRAARPGLRRHAGAVQRRRAQAPRLRRLAPRC